ncbi:MAG: O-antigen polymerase [Dysgonomonas sp.]|nr:O-antigen polymerase [Dysgonomonas sp.]
MLLIVGVFLLIISFFIYKKWNSYIAPAVIISFAWGMVFVGYGLISHGMYDISIKTFFVLCIWIFSSLLGAFFFTHVKVLPSSSSDSVFNTTIRSVYYWISVIGVFPLLYIAYKQGTTMEADFLFNLRMANTGIVETEYKYGIFQYVFAIAYVSLLIETYSSEKINKRIIILLIINILLSIITMAKSTFFFLFIPFACIKIFTLNISIKKLIPFLGIIVLFMIFVQLMRTGEDSENVISTMFNVYIFGGIPALDQIVVADTHTLNWGEMTFRFFYTVKSVVLGGGIEDGNYINNIFSNGQYVFVPYPTNVFTVIFPFWMDFGFLGVLVGGLIFGILAGLIYKLAIRKRAWSIVFYSYLVAVLVLPFFGEYLVTNLSYTIQLILLSYIANVFNYRIKW